MRGCRMLKCILWMLTICAWSSPIRADHHTGGEIRYWSSDTSRGVYVIELVLDRYCGTSSFTQYPTLHIVQYENGQYIERTRYAKYHHNEYVYMPCSMDSTNCTASNTQKIERRHYYDTIILEKVNKECLVYYEENYRSYSDNILNTNEKMLLYISFLQHIANKNIVTEEVQRHALLVGRPNAVNYQIIDEEMDSLSVATSRPMIAVSYTTSGGILQYLPVKAVMQPNTLTDARPMDVSESAILFSNNKFQITPTIASRSWMTHIKSEYRRIRIGSQDTVICISRANQDRLFVSSNLNTQFRLERCVSPNAEAKISQTHTTICNANNPITLHYTFPVEKSLQLNRHRVRFGEQDITQNITMARAVGATIDTIRMSYTYIPTGNDQSDSIYFYMDVCHSTLGISFTSAFSAAIEEFNYQIFSGDTILSCSTTTTISLSTIKNTNFSYGTRVSPTTLYIPNPVDTWIVATLVSPNPLCPSKDSIYLNQGSVFTTTMYEYSPSCYGYANGRAAVHVSGTNAPFSYYWSNNATVDSIASLSSGKYIVEIKDRDNCKQYDTAIITDKLGIQYNWTVDRPISCRDSMDGRGHFQITGVLYPSAYQWSHSVTNDSFLSQMGAGSYSGKFLYTNQTGNNCEQPFSFIIANPDSVDFDYVVNDNNCYGESKAKIAILPKGGNLSYYFYLNAVQSASGVYTQLANGLYTVYIKDNKNCISKSKTIAVTSPAKIGYTVYVTHPSCNQSKNGKIIFSNPTGGVLPHSYTIRNNTYTNGCTLNSLDTGVYMVSIRDANNCMRDTTIILSKTYDFQVRRDSFSHARCPRESSGYIQYQMLNGQSPYQYLWNSQTSTTTGATLSLSNLNIGNHKLTILDANNCSWDTTWEIWTPDTFRAVATVKHVSCYEGHDGSIQLALTGGTQPYSSPSWYQSSVAIPNSYNLAPGKYQVQIVDKNLCVYSAEYEIYNAPYYSGLIQEIQSIRCHNDMSGMLRAIPIGGVAPYKYNWTPTGNANDTISQIGAGTYRVNIEDAKGCIASIFHELKQPSSIKIESIKMDKLYCPNSAGGILTVHASGGTSSSSNSYFYALDTARGYSFNNTFQNIPKGLVVLSVKDYNQCKKDTLLYIEENKNLQLELASSFDFILGESALLSPRLTMAGNTYFSDIHKIYWSPTLGLSCADCIETVAQGFESKPYTLTIEYGQGCVAYVKTQVNVLNPKNIFIPNSFTPNHDGMNDEWKIQGRNIKDIDIALYNKNGELVYRSRDIHKGWNGQYRGEPCMIDGYTYMVRATYLDGSQNQYVGILNLIK